MTTAGSPSDDAHIYIICTCTWIGCTQSLIIATILVRENRITQITTDVLINCVITTHLAGIRRYSSMYLYCRYMWVKLFVVKDTDNIASQFHCLTQPATIHIESFYPASSYIIMQFVLNMNFKLQVSGHHRMGVFYREGIKVF